MNTSPFLTRSHLTPNLAVTDFTIFVSFTVSIHTIATSIVYSKLDYCNSLCRNLPKSQITQLQHIQTSLACAVVKAPKSSNITPVLWSLLLA